MQAPEPRRLRTFFPTHIDTFRQCPERFFHKYIRKRQGVTGFSRPLVLGSVTHRLIAAVLPRYMQSGDIAVDLEARAIQALASQDYPEAERHLIEQDAEDVVDLTKTALDMIPGDSRSLLQERKLYKPLGKSGIEIGAQVDLVLQRGDGTIEHIDFKTGKIRDNTVQSAIGRAVVGHRYRAAPEIQSTTLFLAERQRHSTVFSAETHGHEWKSIAQNIRDIRSLDTFPPNPGPLCAYCPFRETHCSVGR